MELTSLERQDQAQVNSWYNMPFKGKQNKALASKTNMFAEFRWSSGLISELDNLTECLWVAFECLEQSTYYYPYRSSWCTSRIKSFMKMQCLIHNKYSVANVDLYLWPLLLGQLLFLGVARGDHPLPSLPVLSLFFPYTNYMHVLSHHIYDTPAWSSSLSPAW